ncbi:flavodoxin domain-containing protein [Corynebacterium pseudotuberculosis]|uniref:Flavodoxin domain-containing protein n=1 Tax=Corynebacterium pseudotuberculosis 258 TaxID=1168865 RepID=A0AAU8PV45_CORPS|nr:flavodoxin domain-containing protein [Corynebacterium pseudotuberculosis]AER68790.1 Hypothetical protein Cp106_0710 [Corynebacterium pseudotuberculosis 1/06-A]AEQ06284.1 hypothetical protein CPCIP5297_03805 [Corynebacterium pseudotuberculosis CIP 52.97]AFB72064.1 hypothetical protein CP316_03785 [Corynebacterium pseudotuberculosis 316]AFH90553.2 hypothetical protein CP31_04015 [Corynebacterium pseudotuberculosis 31]AFK16368.3 hypothetical protein CP258_03800 [Corynebacterium pseudotuberculo
MIHIRFHSVYGSTKYYAEALAQAVGALSIEALDVPIPSDGLPVVILSPVHGPSIAGIKVAQRYHETHPIALVAVGMTLLDVAQKRDQMRSSAPEDCARFYLPGRLDYSQLNPAHRAAMTSLVAFLKAKPLKNANDKSIIAGYNKTVDHVDVDKLKPVIQWAHSAAS